MSYKWRSSWFPMFHGVHQKKNKLKITETNKTSFCLKFICSKIDLHKLCFEQIYKHCKVLIYTCNVISA